MNLLRRVLLLLLLSVISSRAIDTTSSVYGGTRPVFHSDGGAAWGRVWFSSGPKPARRRPDVWRPRHDERHEVIGGIRREFYQRLQQHSEGRGLAPTEARRLPLQGQRRRDLALRTCDRRGDAARGCWPRAEVVFGQRLDLDQDVVIVNSATVGGRVQEKRSIDEIIMEGGAREKPGGGVHRCDYEGDLMAKAGVTYTVGREANSRYSNA